MDSVLFFEINADDQEDARKIVSWNKYPPKGTRGFGPMFSAHSFGLTEPEYPAGADDNLLVIVQIESKDGVKNVEEIAAVEGIDVLFIGESRFSFELSTGGIALQMLHVTRSCGHSRDRL